MKGIVDRYEGEFVVIEVYGVTKDILKADVDPNVKVGDTVVFSMVSGSLMKTKQTIDQK